MPRALASKPLLVAGVSVAAVVGLGGSGLLSPWWSQFVDDLGQLGAGLAAALACWIIAPRRAGAQRRWRLWMGAAASGWTVGQCIWSWYQLFADTPLPSPSAADAGYLTLPVFALPAVISLAAARPPSDGPRRRPGQLVMVLDGLIVVGALFVLTWATTLGSVVHAGAPNTFAFVVAIAYPVTDLVLTVIVILLVAGSAPQNRAQLTILGGGLLSLSLSDSIFAYLVSKGAERMPPLADAGFVAGMALVAVAALTPLPRSGQPRAAPAMRRGRWVHLMLPYAPVAGTGVLLIVQLVRGIRMDAVEIAVETAVISLLIIRQAVTLIENAVLLDRLSDSRARLTHQAFHDGLTGLSNRVLFHDRLEHALALHHRDGHQVAVLFCDLDDFKAVNDRYGHHAGDRLLREVAGRLRASVRDTDTVARVGGDEFAILLEGGGDPGEPAERIMAAIARPFDLDGAVDASSVRIGVSIGLVQAGEHGPAGVSADALLRRADAAMYAGKRQGKGALVRYRIDLPDGTGSSDLAEALAATLRDGAGLDVHYQPIVRLSDGTVVAVEALARWTHPVLGPIAADVFVATAEELGLIRLVDDFVLDRACRDAAAFAGPWADIAVHVNTSAARLGRKEHEETVRAAVHRHGLAPHRLLLELTETVPLPDVAAAAWAVHRLRHFGVRFALDDFGTGYNALAYLHALPVDEVKLDRSFTAADGRSEAICRSIVQICTGMGVTVVAEGIETVEQQAAMAALGCALGQGHHYGVSGPLARIAPPGVLDPATARRDAPSRA
ncbi:putative bifunctional diguanylate cyclase/phosphodiesterase [Dactylosporangium matsuzakiense]|uniref:GGDEF-domain containing protein n=1 Tax=Dactylosporangium matsuzakiense TaxID=53360 RepID=A0A9W6KK42_9ACTN|nr:EAL domain-containing protein [Dactylosporangium matsuzakiense]UWZ47562.1 EAL domain-containing protein [Dactylosporangium matsuzakiense]GLL01610.1 GGDEF-domain containing protein [Dactylosporangium matsuzakiense]